MNSKSMEKHFITANQLLEDSFRLARLVYESGFRPDFIVGVWRGGTPVAIAVQEYFAFKGIETDHIAIRTSSYHGIGEQDETVRVHGTQYLIENVRPHETLLLVDDVFDSGRSVKAILDVLAIKSGSNMPETIKVACPWYKPKRNVTTISPEYYLRETDQWLVFPHELAGLTNDEILSGKQHLAEDIKADLTSQS